MDSGNSGSLQSSSDADEDYDSRAAVDSVSAFFAGGPVSSPPTQPPAAGFDPFSNYWQLHHNPNTTLHGSGPSAPPPRSDPSNQIHQDIFFNPLLSNLTPPELPPPPQSQNPPGRNPRKRSRASRRAPTTVLTTDTTNFRAMVQEFTGIPSPLFNSSPFMRTRFDPFGTRMAGAAQPPPYLRRPFAQKFQSPLMPPLATSASFSSSLLGPSAAAIDAAITASSTNHPSISIPQINHQLPIAKASNLLNLNPNPILTSILQTNPKFPITTNSPLLGESKSQDNSFEIFPSSNDDQFGSLRWSSNPAASDGAEKFNGGGGLFNLRTNGKAPAENDVVTERGEGMVESSWICSSE